MNKININEIIKIEQMPKVFSQLEQIGIFIDEQIKDIDILECNEKNKQEVKQRRTKINNILKELDDRRKFIKNKLLEPYEIFNDKYEKECKNKLIIASETLKTKIDDIEEQQKEQKRQELYDFAMEYFLASNIQDYVTFDDIGLNITLSASMKSLKEQIVDYCDKVVQDFNLIKMEEFRDEILVEYKKYKDFYTAKQNVITRHNLIQQEQERRNALDKELEEIRKTEEKVEEVLTTPKEIIENDEIISVTFIVKDTKENIIKVRDFMKKEGIKYE